MGAWACVSGGEGCRDGNWDSSDLKPRSSEWLLLWGISSDADVSEVLGHPPREITLCGFLVNGNSA